MAKAIEKGATYLDKLCHKFYDEPKGRGERTGYVCRLCGGPCWSIENALLTPSKKGRPA